MKDNDLLVKNNNVLLPYEFLEDFTREAKKARKRIWTQAMYFEPGKVTSHISKLLIQSASKHVDTKLHIDWFGLLNHSFGVPLFSLRQKKERLINKLKDKGVDVMLTNKPSGFGRFNPYSGRNHMKMTIVDNIAYIGGINFADKDFSFLDFMLKINNKHIVSAIASQFLKVQNNLLIDDVIKINSNNTLLIDSGMKGRSVILNEAVNAINYAEKNIIHTNQFVPDGKLLRSLYQAKKRGVNIKVVVPEANTFNIIFWILYKINYINMYLKGNKLSLIYYPKMLHAKLTIIDNKTVLIGSHNLVEKGVHVGTAEILLYSRDKLLVKNLLSFVKRNII